MKEIIKLIILESFGKEDPDFDNDYKDLNLNENKENIENKENKENKRYNENRILKDANDRSMFKNYQNFKIIKNSFELNNNKRNILSSSYSKRFGRQRF